MSSTRMTKHDIHQPQEFFEYLRVEDSVPAADPSRIDVALLDMNHSMSPCIVRHSP